MTAAETTDDWPWSNEHNEGASRTEKSREDRATAIAAARCFGTPDGAKILDHLREITIERVCGPHLSEAVLRDLEGQRRLVHQICALVERGRNGD